jgi:hypothetical protein
LIAWGVRIIEGTDLQLVNAVHAQAIIVTDRIAGAFVTD